MRIIKVILILFIVFLLLVLRGCRGRVIPDRKVYFTDANSNKIIPSVLIVPYYSEFMGIRYIGGGGNSKEWVLLANPFVYSSSGSPLIIKQPRSPGLFIGVYIGKGISVSGIVAIAKGYEPLYISGDNLWSGYINSSLKPLDEKNAQEQLNRISNGLHAKDFKVLLPEVIRNTEAYPFKYGFSKKDLKMIETFFGIDTKKH